MSQILLSAKHIRKAFDEKQPAILNDLSPDIHEGDFTVVMGPSCAGKSTLLYPDTCTAHHKKGTTLMRVASGGSGYLAVDAVISRRCPYGAA